MLLFGLSQPGTPIHSQYKNNGTTAAMTNIAIAATRHLNKSLHAMFYLHYPSVIASLHILRVAGKP
jgi:hypothetical protein